MHYESQEEYDHYNQGPDYDDGYVPDEEEYNMNNGELNQAQLYELEVRKMNDEKAANLLKEKELCALIGCKLNNILQNQLDLSNAELRAVVEKLNAEKTSDADEMLKTLEEQEQNLAEQIQEIRHQMDEIYKKQTLMLQNRIPEEYKKYIYVQGDTVYTHTRNRGNAITTSSKTNMISDMARLRTEWAGNDVIAKALNDALKILMKDVEPELLDYLSR
jgi:hypothetical protein